jgi:tetratricopeptide (TPR) repeat protein
MRYASRRYRFMIIGFFVSALVILPLVPSYVQAQNAKEEEALFVAKKAFEDGFYEVSIGLLDRFLKNYPDSERQAEVELLIARSFLQQGKHVEALNKLEALVDREYARSIRDACLYWLAEVHFKGNSFNKAATYYKKVIDEYPNSAYVSASYYSLGWCLFQEGKFSEALKYFKTVEEKYSKESQAEDAAFKIIECLYNLKDYASLKEKVRNYLKVYQHENARLAYLYFYQAEADYYLNNYSEAIAGYTKAVTSTDVKLKALAKLGTGWAQLKLKRYDDALASFSEVKQSDLEKRSQDTLLLGKAALYLETNKINEARDVYDKLLSLTNDPAILFEAYFGKANALYNLASYDEAVKTYKEALSKQWPDSIASELNDKLHYSLAWAYLKQGEFKEGIKEFQKVARSTDDKIIKVSALCQVGDAYQDQGNYAKAQETYTAILKDYPDSSYSDYVQYQLGVALLKSSNYDGAITIFSTLKNNFLESKLLDDAFYSLGLAYFQKQDYAASRDVFSRFGDDYKDSYLKAQAAYLLGASLFNLGKFGDAITVFENVIKKFNQDQELVQKCEYEIADCFYQMGNEEEALKRFTVLRTKYPDSGLTAEVVWWLG